MPLRSFRPVVPSCVNESISARLWPVLREPRRLVKTTCFLLHRLDRRTEADFGFGGTITKEGQCRCRLFIAI